MMPPAKKRLLITAGPTREMLDPVRFLSNLSTGEMGYTLARVAHSLGYQVTLLSGPTALKPPRGVRFVSFTSARDLKKSGGRLFAKQDVLVMTAAVCDFTAAKPHERKIRRTRTHQIHLKKTPDIVAGLAKQKGKKIIIGFSLETEDWLANARRKLWEKSLDGIVANVYQRGCSPFGKRAVTAALIDRKGKARILKGIRKDRLSRRILEWIEELVKSSEEGPLSRG